MSATKSPRTESRETPNIQPILSPDSQKDLEEGLVDETESPDYAKKIWVEETRRGLYKAFAKGRKVEAWPHKGIDAFQAVEGTDNDLRHTLATIYEKHGRLAMYDRGVDGLARHWVEGYQSIRGKQTVHKVMLYVSGTEWTRSSSVLDSLKAMIEAEDAALLDNEDWTILEKPVEGVGSKYYRT